MNSSLVSIIIPAYNAQKYIKETIESALNQTHKNIEVIVVDDGSTDNTKQVLEPYIKRNKIRYSYQENQGQSAGRNNGFNLSKGDFILFLDHDDILLLGAVEESLKFLKENSQYGLVYFDFCYFFNDDLSKKYHHCLGENYSGLIFDKLIKYGPCCNPSQALIKRKVSEKFRFNSQFDSSEDWDYWLSIARQGIKFGFLDKVLVYRRIAENSDSASVSGRIKCKNSSMRVYQKWLSNLSKEEIKKFSLLARMEKLKIKKILLFLMKYNTRQEIMKVISDSHLSIWWSKLMGLILKIKLSILPIKLVKNFMLFFDQKRNKYNFQLVK